MADAVVHPGIGTGEADRVHQRCQPQQHHRQRRERRQPVAPHLRDARDPAPAHRQQHGMEQRIGIADRHGAPGRHRQQQCRRHARQRQAEGSRSRRIVLQPDGGGGGNRHQHIGQTFQPDAQTQRYRSSGKNRPLFHQPEKCRQHQRQLHSVMVDIARREGAEDFGAKQRQQQHRDRRRPPAQHKGDARQQQQDASQPQQRPGGERETFRHPRQQRQRPVHQPRPVHRQTIRRVQAVLDSIEPPLPRQQVTHLHQTQPAVGVERNGAMRQPQRQCREHRPGGGDRPDHKVIPHAGSLHAARRLEPQSSPSAASSRCSDSGRSLAPRVRDRSGGASAASR